MLRSGGRAVARSALEPLDDQRALACVDVPRWGNPDGKESREHIFTALTDGPEETFDGFTIPTSCRAGWWHCPDHCADQEFIWFTLDHATYQ